MPPAYPDSPESGCAVVATVTKLFGFPKRCLKGVLAGGSWSATHHGWSGHSRWADGWSTTKQVSPAKKEGQCEGQVRQLRAGDCGWRSLAFHACQYQGFFLMVLKRKADPKARCERLVAKNESEPDNSLVRGLQKLLVTMLLVLNFDQIQLNLACCGF